MKIEWSNMEKMEGRILGDVEESCVVSQDALAGRNPIFWMKFLKFLGSENLDPGIDGSWKAEQRYEANMLLDAYQHPI